MATAIVLLWLTSALGLAALGAAGRPSWWRVIAWVHGGVGLGAWGLVLLAAPRGGPATSVAAALLTAAAGTGVALFASARRGGARRGPLLLAHVACAIAGIIAAVFAAAASFVQDG